MIFVFDLFLEFFFITLVSLYSSLNAPLFLLIFSRPSVTWKNDLSSLVFFSRTDCILEVKKIEDTIRAQNIILQDPTSTETQVKAANRLKRRAENSLSKWTSLFSHWETDERNAKQPVNEFSVGGIVASGDGNRMLFGSSQIRLSTTVPVSSLDVTDYQEISTDEAFTHDQEGSNVLLGLDTAWKPQYKKCTATNRVSYNKGDDEMKMEVLFKENAKGDQTCGKFPLLSNPLFLVIVPYRGNLIFAYS